MKFLSIFLKMPLSEQSPLRHMLSRKIRSIRHSMHCQMLDAAPFCGLALMEIAERIDYF
jgi:hypothetical protein